MANDDYSSGVKSPRGNKRQAARKVNRKRIGVTRANPKTHKKEDFLDIYVDWPVKHKGVFEFNGGNDLAPFASVSEYEQTSGTTWRFELNGAYLFLESLLSGHHGKGQFLGDMNNLYTVTWKVEQKYYQGE
jgi:hypothetical protein